MMSVRTSRTAEPLPEGGVGHAMGTWGLWLGLVALAMFVAGLAAAALYLHTGQQSWPPEGIAQPGMEYAGGSLGLAFIGAAIVTLARVRMRSGARRPAAVLLAIGTGGLIASAVVLATDLQRLDFRWDTHAYGSIYWILTASAALFVSVAAMMAIANMVQTLVGLLDERRHLELTNTLFMVWFAAATAAGLLALVHLLPTTTGGG